MSTGQQNGRRASPPSVSDPSRYAQRSAALAACAVCVLVAVFAGAGQAADDAGVHEFFMRSQAYQGGGGGAPSRPSRQAFAPVWRPAPAVTNRGRASSVREVRVPARRWVREPRERYASLPRAEERPAVHKEKPAKAVAASPKPAPSAGGDPIAAVMRDATLRPGDIVIFPDGPRVFKGDRGVPHVAGSFEDVGQSRHVSKSLRKAVFALIKTPASPGKAARAYVQKALPADPGEGEREARDQTIRVVYPTAVR
jgi:hypothetical protein